MKLKKIKAKINDHSLECEFKYGINFVFYENETQKYIYSKAFQLLFDQSYYADDFYEKNLTEVKFELSDNEINYTLDYTTMEDGFLLENLLIEGKNALWFHEIKVLINDYLKKNGYNRMFDTSDIFCLSTPGGILRNKKSKKSVDYEYFANLFEFITNIKPVFINKQKDCRLMLLADGDYYLEGEREDDYEQYILAEYFKFVINAKVYDEAENLDFCSSAYPLFVCGLFEQAGGSADTEGILGILSEYRGQTIFLCSRSMEQELHRESLKGLIEQVDSDITLPF